MINDWNLNHLSAFLALAKTLHFTQAARELGVSQPNVSRQVRALEESLHSQLFIRSQRKVVLSEAGRQLYERLRAPLTQIHEALGEAREGSEELSGNIRIGSLTEIGQFVLFPMLTAFQSRHPKVDLEVSYLPGNAIMDQLKLGQLDFGLVPRASDAENMRFYEVFEENFVLVAGPQPPPPIEGTVNLITYRPGDPAVRQFVRRYAKALPFRHYREILTVNSHRSMAEALSEFPAYAIIPSPGADQLITKAKLRVLFRSPTQTKLYLAHLENDFLGRKLKALRDHILAQARVYNVKNLT